MYGFSSAADRENASGSPVCKPVDDVCKTVSRTVRRQWKMLGIPAQSVTLARLLPGKQRQHPVDEENPKNIYGRLAILHM
jgi:hypothetical protein